jgi:hypothetical protein
MGTIDDEGETFAPPAVCARCGLDPRSDAPFELNLEQWMALEKAPCPSCAASVPTLAVRCRECRAATRVARDARFHADFQTGVSLCAVSGDRVVLEAGRVLSVVRVGHGSFALERRVEGGSNRGVALSHDGVLARVGADIALLRPDATEWTALPDAPDLDAAGVAFVDGALVAFPGARNELDEVVPWSWNGTRWEPLVAFPSNEGWEGDIQSELDGACVHAGGETYLVWAGSVYRWRGQELEALGGEQLRTRRTFALAPLGAGVVVVSDQRLRLVEATRSTLLGEAFVSGVHPAPDGAALATCLRNDARTALLVLWPDGTTTSIQHDWLGTDPLDSWAAVPVGGTLVVVRGDDGRPYGVSWAAIARLPRGRWD